MGFAWGSFAVPRSLATLLYLQLSVFSLLKTILKIAVSRRLSLSDESQHRTGPERDCHDPQDRPPASLVPLPPHLTTSESIKERLPIMTTSEFAVTDEDSASSSLLCVVCMEGVDSKEEIRLLSICRHVFHAECLDCWIDEGHVTCPLCRSELVRGDGGGRAGDPSYGGDPWRMERMIYLFGEDFVMGT